jgi:hypothetical protein
MKPPSDLRQDLEKVIEAMRQALFVRIDQIEASFRSHQRDRARGRGVACAL